MNPAILTNTFEPSELAFLKRFFDDKCVEHGLTGASPAASDLAARIIHLYQRGVKDEYELSGQLEGCVPVQS